MNNNDKIIFYLPDFYYNFNMNMKFITYFQNNRNLFYDNIEIGAVYGSFPGMIWNGGRLLKREYADLDNMVATLRPFNESGVAIRFTCTNSLLDSIHLQDTYCNKILEVANNGMNEILVNSELLEYYLRDKYPDYKYISSTTKCINGLESLEEELNKDYFLVVPEYRFNNTEDLFNISKPEKCEILLNDCCDPECKCRAQHYESYCRNILFMDSADFKCNYPKFKSKSVIYNIENNPSAVKVEDLYSKYIDAGFRHFKIVGRTDGDLRVFESYLYYMVKPENVVKVLSDIYD